MKICTDACILGAWFAATTRSARRVLDIGSGTGLLMMMLAQKLDARIDGIEIEQRCFEQLQNNVSQNGWSKRLRALHGDVRSFSSAERYDFIITNPPFFDNDVRSQDEREQLAKHSQQLSLTDLLGAIDKHLDVEGAFGILLPYHRWQHFHDLAIACGFFQHHQLFIRHSPLHPNFRAILQYGRQQPDSIGQTQMSIHKSGGGYSDEFVALLRDYYLYL